MLSDWIRLVQNLKFYLFATNWCTVELSSGSHGQAAGQRGLTVLGHLAGVFDQSGVAKSFRSVSPYCIAWSDVALHVCHETVPKSQILYAFNGNIVALCIADSRQVIFCILYLYHSVAVGPANLDQCPIAGCCHLADVMAWGGGRSWVRIPVLQGVMGSDGICKYLSCFKFNPMLMYACVRCFCLY